MAVLAGPLMMCPVLEPGGLDLALIGLEAENTVLAPFG